MLQTVRNIRGKAKQVQMYLAPERTLREDWPRLRDALNTTGICFVHIPKTAGNSIGEWLYGFGPGHRRWDHYQRLDPENFPRWHKFAVVRDPVDRFISAYRYLRDGGADLGDGIFGLRYVKPYGINDFAGRLHDGTFRSRVMGYFHFHPQARYVTDGDRLMVDRLVPFERLGDLPALLGRDGPLPTKNQTRGEGISRNDLSPETLATICDLYADDFALRRL